MFLVKGAMQVGMRIGMAGVQQCASLFLNPAKVPGAPSSSAAALHNLYRVCKESRQNVPNEHVRRSITEKIHRVEPKFRDQLFVYIQRLAQKTDPKWGERHAADDCKRLMKALDQVAVKMFDQLGSDLKSKAYGIAYNLAGKPKTKDPKWGEHHIKDSGYRLLHVIDTLKAQQKPKLNWDEYEKRMKNKSSTYHLNRKELPHGEIGYVNGMGTTKQAAMHNAKRLSNDVAQKYNIHGVHAATNGKMLDYAEAAMGYSGIATTPVFMIQKQWKAFFDKHPNARYLQICYSKGAIHVRNALETFDHNLRKRVVVLAIAPAHFMPKGLCGRVQHYVIKKDKVPYYSPDAARIGKKDSDIVIVPPHSNRANAHDPHGPSYTKVLKHEIADYIKKASA